MKPAVLDLCKGLGGWTRGLKAAGWWVAGVDIEDYSQMTGYVEPDAFILADVREIAKDVHAYFPALKFDLVVASPPCQEFSYSSFPFRIARERFSEQNPPKRDIWDACVKIAKDLGVPFILENVRGAKKWMGKNAWHYGSFYFWGEMPALIPIGRPMKGFQKVKVGNTRNGLQRSGGPLNKKRGYKKMTGSEKYRSSNANNFEDHPSAAMSSKSKSRKDWASKAAMIPEELSTWIGECFYPRDLK